MFSFCTWLRNLSGIRGSRVTKRQTIRRSSIPLGVEILETREVPSANVPGFTLSGGILYETEAGNTTKVASNVVNFTSTAPDGRVYAFEGDGTLWGSSDPLAVGWQKAASNVVSFTPKAADGWMYVVEGDGTLWGSSNPISVGWQKEGSNVVSSTPTAPDGSMYVFEGDGTLWGTRDPVAAGWQKEGSNVVSFTANAAGMFVLEGDGTLWGSSDPLAVGWQKIDTGVQTIVSAGPSSVFDLRSNGQLVLFHADGSGYHIANDVQSLTQFGLNNVLYLTGGTMYACSSGGSPTYQASGVQALAQFGAGQVLYLLNNGQMYSWGTGSSPMYRAGSVQGLAMGRDGQVYCMVGGTIYRASQTTGSGWSPVRMAAITASSGNIDNILQKLNNAEGLVEDALELMDGSGDVAPVVDALLRIAGVSDSTREAVDAGVEIVEIIVAATC